MAVSSALAAWAIFFAHRVYDDPSVRKILELTVVLAGMLRVEHEDGAMDVLPGQAVVTEPGEWVRYSTPDDGGAEYLAVCLPAFSPATVHRDT